MHGTSMIWQAYVCAWLGQTILDPPLQTPTEDKCTRRVHVFAWFGGIRSVVYPSLQTPTEATWYRGSADAVRRNLPVILEDYRGSMLPDDLLILSGQALYRMVSVHAYSGCPPRQHLPFAARGVAPCQRCPQLLTSCVSWAVAGMDSCPMLQAVILAYGFQGIRSMQCHGWQPARKSPSLCSGLLLLYFDVLCTICCAQGMQAGHAIWEPATMTLLCPFGSQPDGGLVAFFIVALYYPL